MPPILESPKTVAPIPDRQSTLAHRIAVNVPRLLILIVISVCLSGGWYLAKRGFGRQWRYCVGEGLHNRGAEAYGGRLTLDPFRRLIPRDGRMSDSRNPSTCGAS